MIYSHVVCIPGLLFAQAQWTHDRICLLISIDLCDYIMRQNKFSDSMTQWWQQLKRLSSFSHIYFWAILPFAVCLCSIPLFSQSNCYHILFDLHASTLCLHSRLRLFTITEREKERENEIFWVLHRYIIWITYKYCSGRL